MRESKAFASNRLHSAKENLIVSILRANSVLLPTLGAVLALLSDRTAIEVHTTGIVNIGFSMKAKGIVRKYNIMTGKLFYGSVPM
jgi:stage V sporulation protein SpoVS